MTSIPSQTEREIVASIRRRPNSRSDLLKLAAHLEEIGELNEAKQVYRGNLPPSLQDRHGLDPYPRSNSEKMNSCERLSWYGEELYPLEPPLNEDPKRNSIFQEKQVKTRPEFVDLMENCSFIYDGKNRLYSDENGIRNTDHSTVNAYLLIPRSLDRANATHLSGMSLMLAGHNSHNFYHWHFDRLTAIGLTHSAGIKPRDIDNILIDKRDTTFQTATLKAAGFKDKQIRHIGIKNSHFICDQLLMVRQHNSQGMALSRRHLDWMRRTYLPHSLKFKRTSERAISRIAIRRDTRTFTNAEYVYDKLEKHGYRIIQPEHFSYEQQVSLFVNASHIVAPHGAGLTLATYCKPSTIIHEFYADQIQPCFWTISSALGLNYHNYNCSDITDKATSACNKNLKERLEKSISISDTQLSQVLEEG